MPVTSSGKLCQCLIIPAVRKLNHILFQGLFCLMSNFELWNMPMLAQAVKILYYLISFPCISIWNVKSSFSWNRRHWVLLLLALCAFPLIVLGVCAPKIGSILAAAWNSVITKLLLYYCLILVFLQLRGLHYHSWVCHVRESFVTLWLCGYFYSMYSGHSANRSTSAYKH